jgi:Rrf2 family protein
LTCGAICHHTGYEYSTTKRSETISSNTRFAIGIHCLTLLAGAGDEPVTSDSIAGSVNTNPVFIRRVLGQLQRAGLVESQPGVGGGWRLRRDPAAITLLEVFHSVEDGQLVALHHRPPNPACPVGRNIERTLRGYFGEAERAFEQVLAGQTVAQVLRSALAGATEAAS